MMVLMTAALASMCASTTATTERFKPKAGGVDGEGAGWPKAAMKAAPASVHERWKSFKSVVKRYPADRQQEFLNGEVRTPIEEVGLFLAWGEPDYWWKRRSGCRALLYATDHDRLFETCKGNVVQEFEVGIPLDCERMDAVVPRIEKRQGRFRDLELEQQLELIGGVPGEWMDKKDVELAFGEPFKKKGEHWLYHDDSGVIEGPIVTYNRAGYVAEVRWPDAPEMTRKGKRKIRKAEAQARRDALADYRKEEARQRRKSILKAVAVVAVVATAVVVASELENAQQPAPSPTPSPTPRPSPRPTTSTSQDGRSTTTTTQSEQNGIPVTERRTVVDDRPVPKDGTHAMRVMCAVPFTADIEVKIRGDQFEASGMVDTIIETDPPTPPERADRVSGTWTRIDRYTIEMPGLGTGQLDDFGTLRLTTGVWPHAACAGKQTVSR